MCSATLICITTFQHVYRGQRSTRRCAGIAASRRTRCPPHMSQRQRIPVPSRISAQTRPCHSKQASIPISLRCDCPPKEPTQRGRRSFLTACLCRLWYRFEVGGSVDHSIPRRRSTVGLIQSKKAPSRIHTNADLNYRRKTRTPLLRSPKFRLSISLSLLLLIHRLLYRFLVRLRANLRTDDAQPFRERNPRISRALTSRLAPAIGASLAGFALGICPQDQLRLTAAIYTGTRSLEFLFNVLDSKGWLDKRPWWFGSWLLMPISFAQLFHAFVFDRETTPNVCVRNYYLSMNYGR